ncbi:unnamed protein product [Pylaiella littoralis]
MGCSSSVPAEAQMSASVDRQLAEAEEQERNHFKILLLGAGESGKSTVLKQMKMIYKGRLADDDLQQCVMAIRKNTVECMQGVLRAMDNFEITLGLAENAPRKKRVRELPEEAVFDREVADDIASLWADPGVREAYDRQSEYWLLDAASYYFDNALRLGQPDYAATDEDVIMTRIRTTGIDTTEFSEPPHMYSVVDVGGQRNERRKWIHCFDNVRCIVFLVGLNGYNQCLFEDSSVNKMQESLALFQQVVSNPIFRSTPIFLFLNKKDIFETMIKRTPLTVCFPSYTGPERDVHAALQFMEAKYAQLLEAAVPGKELHTHVVAARVRMDMKVAWGDVKDQVRRGEEILSTPFSFRLLLFFHFLCRNVRTILAKSQVAGRLLLTSSFGTALYHIAATLMARVQLLRMIPSIFEI